MIKSTKRFLLIGIVLFTCVGCDQATKFIAKSFLEQGEVIALVGDIVRIQYAENTGAFLSLGGDLSNDARYWLFTVLTSIMLVGLTSYVFLSKKLSTPAIVAISFVIGGGIGNIIDRILYGSVVDFLNIGVLSLRTGIFNFADVAIMFGAAMLLWDSRPGVKGGRFS